MWSGDPRFRKLLFTNREMDNFLHKVLWERCGIPLLRLSNQERLLDTFFSFQYSLERNPSASVFQHLALSSALIPSALCFIAERLCLALQLAFLVWFSTFPKPWASPVNLAYLPLGESSLSSVGDSPVNIAFLSHPANTPPLFLSIYIVLWVKHCLWIKEIFIYF